MDTMTGGRTTLTRADRDALPDDGCRHELLDGVLLVTPAPGNRHQHAVGELFFALRAACPPDLRVRTAPFDVTLAVDTVVQPDVLVTRRDDLVERGLDGVPLLVVEVLSPSTRRVDEHLKRARYEAAGVASYWLVDVDDPAAPVLTVLTLRDAVYVEEARVVGNKTYAASAPFALRVSPAELVD
jgi:Uma2 family endonuclease